MKLLVLGLLLALVAFASGQSVENYPIYDRPCDVRKEHFRTTVKTAFNTAAYTGTWFEIERYQQRDEAEADCMSSHYSWGFISRTFTINRAGHDFTDESSFERRATALLAFPEEASLRGMLNVTYYADREADETNYYVIATDYFQYSVGWACEDISATQSREFAWVLSRTPDLPADYRPRVDALIDLHFDRTLLRPTIQSESYCQDRIMPGSKTD